MSRTHSRLTTPVVIIGSLILLVVSFVISLMMGPVTVPLSDLASSPVVTEIRAPRIIIAALVGAALAVSGAIMQTVFHNPLADPGIVGVSSGAAVAAVLAIVTGASFFGEWTIPFAAFIGAIITVAVVYLIASSRAMDGRGADPATLVLVGLAITAFLGAVISAATANAPQDSELRSVTFWLNGDLVSRTWDHVGVSVIPIIVGLILAVGASRDLNLLLLGESTAQTSGLNVGRARIFLLALAALLTATAVAVSGTITFVGLVVPHLIRIVIGADHRALLPAAAILGATFVIVADTVARMLFSPIVLQTGVVVAFIGSPIFLYLLLTVRKRRGLGL
ncbi:FecCD family ABC transporter permease [Corynebacterium efficiens]|uniref:Putative ferrichrome ABC transporter permease protein n=1 Tax=Corynebacterium efficiens (strain DSM 44549 / YS-314 / AJ 12310 / JCM 11189 / NBRC 100395) TaxID=196164 RepID=Q8FRR5_COREF|nr:iron ABC transporter permease [Corynebacterium efficiens]BAC17504.1 putative ferrichrome ABC transporter permease protein [Corynebacterium efficiens YS-314]